MPRAPRAFIDGIFHLCSHASDTRHLFLSDDERATFLGRLSSVFERFEVGVVSYTLMGNHYHVIAAIQDDRVSRALQQLHTWHSRRHNRIHGRRAHLFLAHPFAREIENDEDLLATCRYVAHNPVEAGLAPHPFAWRWSSAAATAGFGKPPIALDLKTLRAALGGPPDWRQRYRALLR